MNYSNPLQTLMQMGQRNMNQSINPMSQLQQMARQNQQSQGGAMQNQPINHQQFIQNASQLDEQTLAGLVGQARQQGISEQDIETGLNFLMQFRK